MGLGEGMKVISRHAQLTHDVIPAKAGTAVSLCRIANRGSRFRGNDPVDGKHPSADLILSPSKDEVVAHYPGTTSWFDKLTMRSTEIQVSP